MKEPRASRRQRNAPTISDVAKLAGVSPMTVSRVINNEGNVRDETREIVRTAIAELNYAPSAAARALAGGEEIRIGLLHSNPSFAYLSEFLVGSLDQASRSNVQLVVEKCDEAGLEGTAVEHLMKGRIDGIVLPPPLSDSAAVLAALEKQDVLVVAVATGRAPEWAMAVSIDDARAAYDMTRHLGGLGHRRIGFITGNRNQTASGERLAGYRMALADLGLPDVPELVAEGLFTYRSGLDAADQLLDLTDPPTAIFASNDDMAAATVAIAHRRGLDVPGDLTVCGFDDTALATTIWPELTTIRQPVTEMSRTAVDLLVRAIRARKAGRAADPEHPRQVTADYTLVRRQSDAAPRQRPAARRSER
ncbi:LacI family DNA-binding transcriptional regulator [Sphingomonas mollis]|uniref:LacI family DNA-binding transcriptional regulator n=1 Tax=Sphingomonas mollis TaxID=2795726 RepID=A0ABS0XKR5_9SPHN|nr:LacI family DNA-binding transcriptional regulator [Sphingomonas sp. BT553]MBJ6120420.1 LacI family DNA-binding transcriptional regulator [Sphingomonas sp. BT553]